MPPVPADLDDITPEWIASALRTGGWLAQGDVESVAVTVIGEEFGFTGVVARIEPAYTQERAGPPSIVAKLPLAGRAVESGYSQRAANPAARRELADRSALELRFYTELAPRAPAVAPRLLYGAVDPRQDRAVLLLEDLRHARQADLLGGIGADEARAVLRTLARFHAAWWHDAADADWIPGWGIDSRRRHERYLRVADSFMSRHARVLPARVGQLVEHLKSAYPRVLEELVGGPRTIIHGDLHADNVLLAEVAEESLSAFLLDWQMVALGPPAVDLNLLLVGSMTTDARRSHEAELIGEYHELLRRDGVTDIALGQLLTSYRQATLWHLAATVGWLAWADGAVLTGRERLIVERLITEPRVFQAAIDHFP
jgi:Ser/Thr protein kinase RdoA (MazF antagonist)